MDCSLLSSKNWSYLISSYNSPFLDSDNTLCLSNINHLDKEQTTRLLSLILDSNLCGRNRVIFSYSTDSGAQAPKEFYEFINQFTCVTLSTSPLRDSAADIPNIANLYLNSLNMELGKGLVGFEPEALDLLQNYSWPYNISQFKRILHETALVTEGSYVTADMVFKSLSRARPHPWCGPKLLRDRKPELQSAENTGTDEQGNSPGRLILQQREPDPYCQAAGHQPFYPLALSERKIGCMQHVMNCLLQACTAPSCTCTHPHRVHTH